MALGAQVVDLVRLHLADDVAHRAAVRQIAEHQHQPLGLLVRVLKHMVDPVGIEAAATADDPVDRVSLAQEELGQVTAVLPGDPGDQRPTAIRPPRQPLHRAAALAGRTPRSRVPATLFRHATSRL